MSAIRLLPWIILLALVSPVGAQQDTPSRGEMRRAARVARRAEPHYLQALMATCRIMHGEQSSTGFLVEVPPARRTGNPRIVLVTAAHALQDMTGPEARLVLRKKHPDGSFTRHEHPIPISSEGKPLWVRHPEQDVAALPVTLPDGVEVTPFPLEALADEADLAEGRVRVGQDLWVPCFPVALESNGAGWPILRRGSVASHPLTPVEAAPTYYVDMSIFGGESGAPVVVQDGADSLVAGLVTGMQRQTNKTVTPLEERTIHMPLGIVIVVQAPLIRWTIAQVAP